MHVKELFIKYNKLLEIRHECCRRATKQLAHFEPDHALEKWLRFSMCRKGGRLELNRHIQACKAGKKRRKTFVDNYHLQLSVAFFQKRSLEASPNFIAVTYE